MLRLTRFITRWLFRLLILLLVLSIGALLLKDMMIKSLAESRLRAATGLETRIGRFEVNLFSPTITLENLKVYNTPDFGGSLFLDVPELHLEYDRPALGRRQVHLKLVRFHLAELHVVDNAAGRRNVEVLQERLKLLPPPQSEADSLHFAGIDVLNLSCGKLHYTNLKNPAESREVKVNRNNDVIKNVQSLADLSGWVLKVLWQQGPSLLRESRPPANPTPPPPRTAIEKETKSRPSPRK